MRRILCGAFVLVLVAACHEAGPPPSAPSEAAGASAPAAAAGRSCLMVNVCTCNLGCASVPLSRAQLLEGVHTRVESGLLAGWEVKVVDVTDASGAHVLALTDLDHDHACSRTPAHGALLGYGCEANKSGPVPSHACAHGCD